MNSDFLVLKEKTRFDEILSINSLEELQKLIDGEKLTPDEIALFGFDDFWYLYAQKNYPELKYKGKHNLPYDETNVRYQDWKEVVLELEKIKNKNKRFTKQLYLEGIYPDLPRELRSMIISNLDYQTIIKFCETNKDVEPLCRDENSELWRQLYFRDISSVPLDLGKKFLIKTKSIYKKFKKFDIFYYDIDKLPYEQEKTSNDYIQIIIPSYKKIYKLYILAIKYAILDMSVRIINLTQLGAEIALYKILDEYKINYIAYGKHILKEAILNDHRHIVDKFLRFHTKFESYEKTGLIKEILEKRGFEEMARYLKSLNLGFELETRD